MSKRKIKSFIRRHNLQYWIYSIAGLVLFLIVMGVVGKMELNTCLEGGIC